MPKSSLPENVNNLQCEVQRKFGRNLLLLQQYEQLAKVLVAEHSITGTVDDLLSVKTSQYESVANKSLGQVVGDLTSNFLDSASSTSNRMNNDDHEAPCDLTQPWMRTSSHIELSEDDFNHTKQKLADLVDLRNKLVHHFLEKHDLWTEAGCLAADTYLDECFKQIDAHFGELQQWRKHRVDSIAIMASYMNTPEFENLFIHGIMPGNAGVYWATSTIINLLRDAETALAKESWTLLSKAIAYIGMREAEQTPKKYGCSSWRQVLHESKQFEIRKTQAALGQPTETWYRSRPCSATLS